MYLFNEYYIMCLYNICTFSMHTFFPNGVELELCFGQYSNINNAGGHIEEWEGMGTESQGPGGHCVAHPGPLYS